MTDAWMTPQMVLAVLAWLATYAIHSTVMIGTVWAVTRGGNWIPHATRDSLWKVALVGAPATASLQVWLGAGLGELAIAASRPVSGTGVGGRAVDDILWLGQGWVWLLGAVWLLGVAWAGTRFVVSAIRLRRLLADRRDVLEDPLLEAFLGLCELGGVRRRVRLSASGRIRSPIALWRREIVVPERALDRLGAEQQRAMLAHELAHVIRGDSRWLALAALFEAVFFFQPLNRVARRGLHETAEVLCDDWAVRHTGEPQPLASCLAEVASWSRGRQPFSLVASMAGKQVVRRVQRLLSDDTVRAGPDRPAWRIGLVLGILVAMAAWAPTVVAARPCPSELLPAPVASAPAPGMVAPDVALQPVPPLVPLPLAPRSYHRVKIETGEVIVEIEHERPAGSNPTRPRRHVVEIEVDRDERRTTWSFPLEIHAQLRGLLPRKLLIPADDAVQDLLQRTGALHPGAAGPTMANLVPEAARSRGRPGASQLASQVGTDPGLAVKTIEPAAVKRPCDRQRREYLAAERTPDPVVLPPFRL